MAYSIKSNSFVSHLTQRVYSFSDRQSKSAALEKMFREDSEVRDAAQQRAHDAGVNKPLTDREIAKGDFMPDRRTTVERVADAALTAGAKHDPFIIGIDTIRARMRTTDSPEVREANESAIARLETKSAELAQARAANPPAVEIDPTNPAANAAALRAAAASMRPGALPEEQAHYRRMVESLNSRADAEDAKAVEEKQIAAKRAANAPWIADADGVLYFIEKDSSIPQETVNSVRAMREKLANLEATGAEWIEFANGVDAQRKSIKESKLAANLEARKQLDEIRDSIRAGTDTNPPAEPGTQP